MQQMEHVYRAWGLGGGTKNMVYGDGDLAGGSVETIDEYGLHSGQAHMIGFRRSGGDDPLEDPGRL